MTMALNSSRETNFQTRSRKAVGSWTTEMVCEKRHIGGLRLRGRIGVQYSITAGGSGSSFLVWRAYVLRHICKVIASNKAQAVGSGLDSIFSRKLLQ